MFPWSAALKADFLRIDVKKTTPISGSRVRPATKPVGSASVDSVRLSSDLRLVDKAAQVALARTRVRSDAVARGRAVLESGTLGQDLDRVADRMIDALLCLTAQ
jgi:hypothetical protein